MDFAKAFNSLVEASRGTPANVRLHAATTYVAYLAAHDGLTYVQLEKLMEAVLEAFTDLRAQKQDEGDDSRDIEPEVTIDEIEIVG